MFNPNLWTRRKPHSHSSHGGGSDDTCVELEGGLVTHASPEIGSLLLAMECHTGGHSRNTFGPTGGRNVQWREAICAANGKQTKTMASCHPPPPLPMPTVIGL